MRLGSFPEARRDWRKASLREVTRRRELQVFWPEWRFEDLAQRRKRACMKWDDESRPQGILREPRCIGWAHTEIVPEKPSPLMPSCVGRIDESWLSNAKSICDCRDVSVNLGKDTFEDEKDNDVERRTLEPYLLPNL